MDKIISFLLKVCPLTPEAKTYIYEHTHREEFKKGDILLKPGEICPQVWFVEKGLLQSYEKTEPNKIISNWFMLKNDIATSVVSFFRETPSEETVKALEDTVVWSMSKADLFAGLPEHPSLLMLTFLITTKYYCVTREMESILRKKNPEKLFAYLEANHLEMVKRVPKKHLSSFMGISEASFYSIPAISKSKAE